MRIPMLFKFLMPIFFPLLIGEAVFAAAPKCEFVFTGHEVSLRPVDFGLNRTNAKYQTPEELLRYSEIRTELKSALSTLPAKRRSEIEHLLSAVEFFDYKHTASQLLPNFLDGKKQTFDFSTLYDSWGELKAAPFNGFVSARDFLKKKQPPVTADLLGAIHTKIMADGVENVKQTDLGVYRDGHWIGNAFGENVLKGKEIEAINSNPYLIFEAISSAKPKKLNDKLWSRIEIWGSEKRMVLQNRSQEFVEGRIHYPFIGTPKQETIDIIKDSHPDLHQKLMEYRKSADLSFKDKGTPEYQREFSQALTEERIARFNVERESLGQVTIGKNEREYIDLVADLQRDLVAIHPVLNGNGRTTRLFMNYLLTKEGLPPVRLVDPFLDVQVSKEEWREYVHKGVLNSAQLQADIAHRIRIGLTVEHSPELLYPGLPETISISLRKEGSKKIVANHSETRLESEQFNAFVKTLVEMHPELRQEILNDRLETMSRLADLFVEHHRTKTVRYIHNKDGEREIRLRLIDPDFIENFGRNRAGSKTQWEAKIDRWYDKDMLVWRGLANRHSEPTKKELIEFFKSPNSHLVSNSVLRSLQMGKPLGEAIKQDFLTFNKELITGDVLEMATDHHRSGPKYDISYGFSTSKREVVGKAFAMGAMVVGKYGEHTDPNLQEKLKGRINVATFRALKDVDLGRLKAIDSEFSYIYGRQAEVMGIGGTDPDAVVLVQRLNAKGEVTETLLRNFDKPNEILVIEGRYVPGEGPLAENRIQERILIQPTTP